MSIVFFEKIIDDMVELLVLVRVDVVTSIVNVLHVHGSGHSRVGEVALGQVCHPTVGSV